MLYYEGFETIEAGGGEEGLRMMREKKPDLILCDIRMPQMDGYDLLDKFRDEGFFQRVPFIYLTALTERKKFRQGMELGADDFLTKPFTREELTGAIETQLNKYQTKEEYLRGEIKAVEKKLERERSEIEQENKKQKKSLAEKEKQAAKLIHRLHQKEVEVTEEALRVIETSNTIQKVKKMISQELQRTGLPPEQEELLQKLKKQINEKKFLLNNWTVFQLRFNQVFPGFANRFTREFENITHYELVFVSATRMGLSTSQIADLLNISTDSVRKSRHRLKKKLGLNKNDDFLSFILALNF